MNRLFKFLIIGFVAISCTEKISDNVEQTATSAEEQKKAQFVNKSIRVVNKGDEGLSFLLHKAGSMSAPCEIPSPSTGFSAQNYDKSSTTLTADCILDAQELDIFFQGVKLQLQVDDYLCKYVRYRPYRFFQFQPGTSTKRKYRVECDEACENSYPQYCDKEFATLSGPFTTGSVNPSTALANINTSSIQTEGDPMSCTFDYSTKQVDLTGPNCDPGTITTEVYRLEGIEEDSGECTKNGAATTDQTYAACKTNGGTWAPNISIICPAQAGGATLTFEDSIEDDCGGSWYACLGGAGVDILQEDQRARGILMSNSSLEYFEYDVEIESPFNKDFRSNLYVSNFSRICSSTGETKTQAKFDTSLFNIVGHEVEDMPYTNSKQGYSFDENGDGLTDYIAGGIHPFNVAGFGFHVKPYYAFECLDAAEDITAQIRVFVREWDKEFDPTNPYIARLSDVNQSNSLMDGEGDQVYGEEWDDRIDWDDIFADYDRNKDNGYDGAFLDNQCTSLTLGYCTDRTFTDEVTCLLPANGTCSNLAFVTQATCEAAGHTWKLQSWVMENYCTNSAFSSSLTCIAGGGKWIVIDRYDYGTKSGLFPNWSL